MSDRPKTRVVVVGGGTAGWLAAAGLSKQLAPLLDITLVESDDIGTVGVGEATIPTMRSFHQLAGVDEREFMRATQATFKLGIEFENWGQLGDRYIHSFGQLGKSNWMSDFHHIWLEAKARGIGGELRDYCYELQAAESNKFATSDQGTINYAFHLDASLYARYLRALSEGRGVTRIEGKVAAVDQEAESGNLRAVTLETGQRVEGDFFVDCTGFRGLLIEQTLNSGFEDWTHWLPTNRALAVQTRATESPRPYTRSAAHDAGWRWQIPLQNRVGNGLVYCSEFLSDDDAHDRLTQDISGERLTEARVIRYRTGRRRRAWVGNCLALGLATGFVEPLESTSIHLIMSGITRLIQLFPFDGISESVAERYNHLTREEFEKVRDFIILHYKLTSRDDAPFWRQCRDMDIPDSLAHRIELFRESAHAYQSTDELFRVDSWVQVMLGQGLSPKRHHHMARLMSDQQLTQSLAGLIASITNAVQRLPTHGDFLKRYCPANG